MARMPEFKTLRGMRDLLPADSARIIHVEDVARRVARLSGYKEIITPVVESYELLAAKAGEEVRSRMFVFRDLGGRDVALRPEFTASIARLVASTLRNEPKPFRLFCMGSAYRYDEPQRGRYREFWQSDYELVGSNRPQADAEIILLTDSLMQGVGLKSYAMKIGHVGVLRGILNQEKVAERQQSAIMQLMDKRQYDDAFRLIKDSGASARCLSILQRLVNCKGADISNIVKKVEELVKEYSESVVAAQNLAEIMQLVTGGGCQIEMTVDAGFARGLEYYTGMIFEVYVPGLDIAVGGGGRYDRLIELFGGEPTPAVGVAHGLDRIALGMQLQKIVPKMEPEKRVIVFPVTEELRGEVFKISRMLRDAGITAEVEVMGRKMTKALEDADRRNVDYALIVGTRELKEGAMVLRDLAERKQRTVKIERIIDEIRG